MSVIHDPRRTFVEGVRATVERYGMLAAGEGVVVAVSGGPDSLSLLYALHALAPELGIQLHVAHLNHRMRPSAEEEAGFVAETAARLGIPCTVGAVDVRALARRSGLRGQPGARLAR